MPDAAFSGLNAQGSGLRRSPARLLAAKNDENPLFDLGNPTRGTVRVMHGICSAFAGVREAVIDSCSPAWFGVTVVEFYGGCAVPPTPPLPQPMP